MSQMQQLPLTGGALAFAGAVSLDSTERGVQPWRVPYTEWDLFEPRLLTRACMPAGVRLTCQSDTAAVELDVAPVEMEGGYGEQEWTFDLLADGVLHQRVRQPVSVPTVRFEGFGGGGMRRLEVYLEQAVPMRISALRIDAAAQARSWRDPRPRWTVYGSSITHCRAAAGPSETWPVLVANRFGLNLTCLGYGGNCHLEPMVARMIRDLPADYISLCLGINVMGNGSLSLRTFRAAVIGLIKTIRDGHPEAPIACVSPLANPPRETEPNVVGLTLVRIREQVAAAVEALRRHGDQQLHYVDGLQLFGPEYVRYMPDQVHPDAEGYRVLAQRYGEIVMPRLGLEPAAAPIAVEAGQP